MPEEGHATVSDRPDRAGQIYELAKDLTSDDNSLRHECLQITAHF
ncbi:hypothetical protein HNR39_000849 [Glaciimonas immobilis]|uniref:Uncharacterized protein n=1 Tax=Glaciimonas immobilis TaxID=728004 RepID=A0A840RRD1_9BURK|nr:hypothetical protein [Glaciimonas immobilis]